MPPALLVLDIDGVLSTPETQAAGGMANFSAGAVAAMKLLLAEVKFDVLLCSSWRVDQGKLLARAFREHGLGELTHRMIGSTPVFHDQVVVSRGEEIDAWLYRSGYRGRLAILDDEEPLPELGAWWVLVGQEMGLNRKLRAKVAQLLTAGPIYTAAQPSRSGS